jgi:hypothetical protein
MPATVSPASGIPSGILSSANVIAVSAGTNTSGIDLEVGNAVNEPNALSLGVTQSIIGGSDCNDTVGVVNACNTGDVIVRGQTSRVLLFGPGLSGSMTVTIVGPQDIQISDVRSESGTNGSGGSVPGVSFLAAVNSNAVPGPRTVLLRKSTGEVTAFTGGLEVAP